MPIWQLCANLLIPNCLRSNLSYSPLAALELYVNKCNYSDLRHRELLEYNITVNDTLSYPPVGSLVFYDGFDLEEGYRYDVKVLDKSIVYVFDIIPTINEQDIWHGMPISPSELYDTIMSQAPELIGSHVLKIDDNEKHDIRKFVYDKRSADYTYVNFYVDLEGRE